jgi:hypothetical protein
MWRTDANTGVLDSPDDAVGGVGGAAGIKSDGMHATVDMTDMMRTMFGMEPRKGLMSCASCSSLASSSSNRCMKGRPTAPPNGFAKLANAVAPTLPPSVNHISLYRVGAASTNGCAKPVRICPNMTSPKMPPFARVPAYRIQLPSRRRSEAARMLSLGPRWRR